LTRRASIVVSTRNRAELLEGSLDSLLAAQPSVDCELIVVDNASTDQTASVVAACRERAAGPIRVEYLVEDRLGLSHARNRGIAAARGDYLLFTDDDVVVEPGWVDALCAEFSEEAVVAVAGRVLPDWPSPPPRWLDWPHAGVLALTNFGDAPRDLTGDEVPLGANMAIRAAALSGSAGPFDTRLGHQGGTYFAYEEHSLFLELREAGGRFAYRPDAVVRHRIRPERMTWSGMRRASLHNGYGSRRAERLRGAPPIPRRVSMRRLARTSAEVLRWSRRNGHRDDVAPEAAWEELRRWWDLGRWIEVLFGTSRLGERLVERLSPRARAA
jgi:glycosyltransferase involved in cell wall biosynthesis